MGSRNHPQPAHRAPNLSFHSRRQPARIRVSQLDFGRLERDVCRLACNQARSTGMFGDHIARSVRGGADAGPVSRGIWGVLSLGCGIRQSCPASGCIWAIACGPIIRRLQVLLSAGMSTMLLVFADDVEISSENCCNLIRVYSLRRQSLRCCCTRVVRERLGASWPPILRLPRGRLAVYLEYHLDERGCYVSEVQVIRRIAAKVAQVTAAPSAAGLRIPLYAMFCLSVARC